MPATVVADDDDDDDDVHLFDPMGDGPLFLIILLVFMVIVSLIFFLFIFIKASLGCKQRRVTS